MRGWLTFALAALAMLLPTAAAAQGTRPGAAIGSSAAETRWYKARIATLEKTTGLQAATIAGIAERLDLNYPGLSAEELLRRLDAQVGQAVELKKRIASLEAKVAALEDPATRDPAAALVAEADKAFGEGRFEAAEAALGKLAFLRSYESAAALDAWLEAVRSQAEAAQLQGTREASDRAAAIRRDAREIMARLRERVKFEELRFADEEAEARYRDGITFGWSESLSAALVVYRDEVLPLAEKAARSDWIANAWNKIGLVLAAQGQRAGGTERAELFTHAIGAYEEALKGRTRERSPEEWAITQTNIANVQAKLGADRGGEVGAAMINEAVTAYRWVLEIRTRERTPLAWATTQSGLGMALLQRSGWLEGSARESLLQEALVALRAAVEIPARERQLGDWAITLSRLAIALQSAGARDGGERGLALIAEAERAHRSVLEVLSREERPLDWASTQNNLGNALKARAAWLQGNPSLAAVNQAIDAFLNAQDVYTRAELPAQWAWTQFNLGNALMLKSERIGANERIAAKDEAIIRLRAALEVFTRDGSPVSWSEAHMSIAMTSFDLAMIDTRRECAHYLMAGDSVRSALTVYTPEQMPYDYRLASRLLAFIEGSMPPACKAAN